VEKGDFGRLFHIFALQIPLWAGESGSRWGTWIAFVGLMPQLSNQTHDSHRFSIHDKSTEERFMRMLAALLGLVFSLSACAQEASSEYLEGKEYVLLEQPVRTTDPSKIEVAEVFAYSCPHCFDFEPLLHAWEKKQASDVYLSQTHAMWNPQMEPLVRGYYTSIALQVKDKTHMAIFNAMHLEHKQIVTAEQWADFFANYGVDKAKALSTFNSFGVTSQIKQAEARARGYKVTGTPEMVVDGKYRVSSRLAGGHAEMLKVVDYLVAKVRAERGTKAPAQ
jgi:thiol:disulfide interchange protein DsbA